MAKKRGTALGERLRQARADKGLSLRDIEREWGINSGYLSQLERGEVTSPTPNVLQKVARAYGQPVGVLMQWAGYIEEDPAGISPNARRALSYIGEDVTEAELKALKAVLDAMRSKGRAGFSPLHRTDWQLDPQEQDDIRKHALAVLRELDALKRPEPVDLDEVLAFAKLVEVGEIELTLEERKGLRARFGGLVDLVLTKLQGVVHLDAGEVFVAPDMHELRRRFVMGHEVGHKALPLHREVFAYLDDNARLTPDVSDYFERQANQFSIELLAKGDRLREEFDGSSPSIDQVRRLAAAYGVSLQATARRVAEESRQACAVAISHRAWGGNGSRMPPRVYCSESFEQRFRWRAGNKPTENIATAVRAVACGLTPAPFATADTGGHVVNIVAEGLDARYAVIVLFGPEAKPSPLKRMNVFAR